MHRCFCPVIEVVQYFITKKHNKLNKNSFYIWHQQVKSATAQVKNCQYQNACWPVSDPEAMSIFYTVFKVG